MTPSLGQVKLARAFAAPARCPHCGDWMIAPASSEFVVGGEIRHYWDCDGCGESTSTIIQITDQLEEPQDCAA